MRITEQEARAMGLLPAAKKRNKYNARKTWIDGICFDSQIEGDYYSQLKLLLRAGQIDGFCRQARFVITDGKNGGSGTEYVADFIVFYPDGSYRIVDVKGKETDVFKLKKKSFKEKYPKLKLELER